MRDDQLVDQVEELLRGAGYDEDARELAVDTVARLRSVEPGHHRGHAWPEDLPQLWALAEAQGLRQVTFRVTAEGDTPDAYFGYVGIEVLDTQVWEGVDAVHRVVHAFRDARLRRRRPNDPLHAAHEAAHGLHLPPPERTPPPPGGALEQVLHLLGEAMTQASGPEQREVLDHARRLLHAQVRLPRTTH